MNELFEEVGESDYNCIEDESAAWSIICGYKDKQPLKTNVLKYWSEKRFTHPLLYKLSSIVLGVPASQVSVERCFSVLKYILSDYRTRLGHDILQDIMIIHLN